MKYWLYHISIFYLSSFAFAASTQVSSDIADWNGDELTLSSQVQVEHELGKMFADVATMKGDPLSELYLSGNVKLFSQKGGKLFCDTASFFQEERLAYFSSEKTLNYTQDDFRISCQKAECHFGKDIDLPRFTLFEIEHLSFMNHVHIQYGKDYSASGGRAVLKNIIGHDETSVQGTITLFPQAPSCQCQLNHGQDQVFASQISMDLSRSEITCKFSSGSILLPLMGKEVLHRFSADHLFMKKDLGEMILKGNVTITGAEGLEMTSDRMILTASEDNYTITALGQTTFHFTQGSSLTCSGCVHWNNAENKIEMQTEKEPLIYEDDHITLLARQGTLLYDHDKEIEFQKVNFEKEVKIITSEFEKGTSYGMADKVVYFPVEQHCILTADDEHNVLFWNEADSIRLSASEIHIEEDPRTEQYHVEGKGKVRFTFDMEGEDVLKKFLSKYLDLKNRSSHIAEK